MSITYFGLITHRYRAANEKKVIIARVCSHPGVFRLIGHLAFFFISLCIFLLHFFFAPYNTHKRTGMTNIDDILEKKKGRNDFSPPFLPLSLSLSVSTTFKSISHRFFSYNENVVIFLL